jgi:hypothetical protein
MPRLVRISIWLLFVVFFTLLPQIAVMINASTTGKPALDLIKLSHARIVVIVFGLVVVFIASLSYMSFLANKGLATNVNLWFVSENSLACAIASFLVGIGVMLVEEE